MCSTSKVNDSLKGLSSSNNPSLGVTKTVSAATVKKDRSSYFLVDVREPSEIVAKPFKDADFNVPLGAICHDATILLEEAGVSKIIVPVCETGPRAEVAYQSIVEQLPSVAAAVLQRGIVGWENPAAIIPDFLVVLGLGNSTEKLSLSLSALASAIDLHENVVLVLMSDGVDWFLKPDSPKSTGSQVNVEVVSHGDPFKPCKAMLNKFLTKGGVILACTTCVKHRGYSFETDMMDCVNPMQMPDLVRMQGEVKSGSLQFL